MGPVPVRRRAVPGQSANGGAVSAVVAVRPRTSAGRVRDPTGSARVSGFLLHVSPGETRARRPTPGGSCGRTGLCLRRLRRGPGRPPEPDQRRRLAASRAAGLRPFRHDAPRVLAGSGRPRAGDAAPGGPPAGDVHDVDRARHLRRGPRALAQRAAAVLVRFLGVFLALGENNGLYPLVFSTVPGFDTFRVPARWLLLWAFGAAVLASLGADWIGRGSVVKLRGRWFWPRALLLVVIVVVAVVWQDQQGEPFPQRRTPLAFAAIAAPTLAIATLPHVGRPLLAVG